MQYDNTFDSFWRRLVYKYNYSSWVKAWMQCDNTFGSFLWGPPYKYNYSFWEKAWMQCDNTFGSFWEGPAYILNYSPELLKIKQVLMWRYCWSVIVMLCSVNRFWFQFPSLNLLTSFNNIANLQQMSNIQLY